ncbi:MAG: SDR family NAD(P)-dependent oxidoreductase, partial [Rhodospirillales bacterium]|nr:SDR family NAD(P)-dependent oxidoreductase [Rhodospirillales bacterium]
MSETHQPVWLITGCSTGFGKALALQIVKRGWKLVATARNLAQIEDIAALDRKNVLAVALDVTDQAQIDAAVKAA